MLCGLLLNIVNKNVKNNKKANISCLETKDIYVTGNIWKTFELRKNTKRKIMHAICSLEIRHTVPW